MKISDLIIDLKHYISLFGDINVITVGEHGAVSEHFTDPKITTCTVIDNEDWSGYRPIHSDDIEEYLDDPSFQRVVIIEGR